MKVGAHPALAHGKALYVGDHVAVVIADTYAQARDARREDRRRLRRAAGRRRHGDGRRRRPAAGPRRSRPTTPSSTGISATRPRPTRLSPSGACHQARSRQQSRDPQRDGAARGARRLRFGDRRHHALHDEPESACRAPRALRLSWARARAQAARHRARRRRRLRLEDLHLRRGDGLRLGGQEDRPAGQMDGRAHRGLPDRRARPRSRHRTPSWRSTRTARSSACACTRSPISAPIPRPSGRRCRPISMRSCCRASTTFPNIYVRGRRGLHQHRAGRRRIAARAARRRPSSSSASSRSRRARPAAIPPSSAATTSSRRSRIRRR